jgi:3-oxoadipate enol-lactonase
MPDVRSAGAAIHYDVSGNANGPWLVMSNSLGTDLGFWDAQARAFGPHFRVLRYDTRGHGGSDSPDGDYSFDQLGADVLAVMDDAGIERARFCGLSMGGVTGMWLGIHAPGRVERLVLCNTGARIGAADIWQQRIDAVRTGGMEAVVEGVVDRWFTRRFQAADPAEVERIRAMILRTPAAGYAGCCAALRDVDLREPTKGIDLPTLVVAGAHDPATPPALAEEIHASIKGSKLVRLDAAHLSNIEAEAAFNDAVLPFLEG